MLNSGESSFFDFMVKASLGTNTITTQHDYVGSYWEMPVALLVRTGDFHHYWDNFKCGDVLWEEGGRSLETS